LPLFAKEKVNLHWFFSDFPEQFPPFPKLVTVEDGALARHLKTVMRMQQGDRLILVNQSETQQYLCQLEKIAGARIDLSVLERLPRRQEDTAKIIAVVSLIKGNQWDWMLQKLTELGVAQIVPLKSHRSVVEIKNTESKLERWRQILKNAAEQSERVTIPTLHEPITLPDLLKESSTWGVGTRLVASERGGLPLSELQNKGDLDPSVLFTVGPEGGWTDEELDMMQTGGFQSISLGAKIFRCETAALYLASVLDFTGKRP
jgi:16S rRNA (uracil1498-N3)-methyltransferase